MNSLKILQLPCSKSNKRPLDDDHEDERSHKHSYRAISWDKENHRLADVEPVLLCKATAATECTKVRSLPPSKVKLSESMLEMGLHATRDQMRRIQDLALEIINEDPDLVRFHAEPSLSQEKLEEYAQSLQAQTFNEVLSYSSEDDQQILSHAFLRILKNCCILQEQSLKDVETEINDTQPDIRSQSPDKTTESNQISGDDSESSMLSTLQDGGVCRPAIVIECKVTFVV